MNPSPKKIDQLEFIWDSEAAGSIKKVSKITSTARFDLEEYFKFLDDVLPDPSISTKKQLPVDKVFELDDKR